MRILTPFDFLAPMMEASQLLIEAQLVIAMRLAGMAGMWPMGRGETLRMVREKQQAGAHAALAAVQAGMAGAALPDIAMAAMRPVRRKTRANVRRLPRKAMGL